MAGTSASDVRVAPGKARGGPRCIALVGPFQSGKTTLLEAILARMGALQRQGTVEAGTSLGDGSPEARAHRMGVELNVASVDFLGDTYTFLDCPGSIEFMAEMRPVLPAVDAAVVVCDADPKKVPALQLVLRELEARQVPRLLFLNRIDAISDGVAAVVERLQPASRLPLLLRQIPIAEGGATVGFVDLALERAYRYQEHAPSRPVEIPAEIAADEKEARYSLLERLSDHDDRLMEELLEEVEPERERVFGDLAHEVQDGLAVPVLLGAALHGNGIGRLMKALRHEVAGVEATVARLGADGSAECLAQVVKTLHTAHGGKLSLVRVLRGTIKDGATLLTPSGMSARVATVARLAGQATHKIGEAGIGDTVVLGRLDGVETGDTLSTGKPAVASGGRLPDGAVMALAVRPRERKDDVKLGAAMRKLVEEDGALAMEQDAERGELILKGQGEMHLRVAVEKLSSKFGVAVETEKRQVGYRETIRKAAKAVRGRHRKQSGGHGQFGDVVIDVEPLPRGEGVTFEDRIVGGVVPRHYIGSVEEGVRAALLKGPLGFPVVDVHVRLTDGSYHSVDSSDMAFQQAARLAMAEALPTCAPVLLEPVLAVEIAVPSEATSRINGIVSSRRGQILGFDARDGWGGWDVVRAMIPEAEVADLIVELRSVTAGVGTYAARFDHLAELMGREAEHVAGGAKGR